jgi:hypothetical protein
MLSPEQIVAKLTHVASKSAEWLAGERGVVLPFGVTLDAAGDRPLTYFPADDHPDSSFDHTSSLVGRLFRQ